MTRVSNDNNQCVLTDNPVGNEPEVDQLVNNCVKIGDAGLSIYRGQQPEAGSDYAPERFYLKESPIIHDKNQFYYDLSASSNALPYEAVKYEDKLPIFSELTHEKCWIGGTYSQMQKQAWLKELEYENDQYLKSYLTEGILEGFPIVDELNSIPTYDNVNYKSAYSGPAAEVIDKLITSELKSDKYIISESKPQCIHSMGAVPKSNGGYRPITDCSRPIGYSINAHMNNTASDFKYQTVDYVTELMEHHDYSASVDIASAYRSISIAPNHRTCLGIRWNVEGESKYLMDTRLCFGIRCAPFIFTQISNFVVRAMARRGFPKIACYLDDYIIFASSAVYCTYVQQVLIHLLISLGFEIAWNKCSSPSLRTRYLGIIFDSVRMEISLPEDKLSRLRTELLFFENKKRVTKRQLQQLVGYLAHCAKVIRGGRLFSRRLVALLRGLGTRKRIVLPNSIKLDLDWWRSFMTIFNGSAFIIRFNFGSGPTVWTDACATGYGVYMNGDWQAGLFESDFVLPGLIDHHNHWVNIGKPVVCRRDDNVNYWELLAVYRAVLRYSPIFTSCHLIIATDNTQVVAMINGSTSINLSCLELLREIFWITTVYNVYLTARYIPGVENTVADKLSRLYHCSTISHIEKLCLCCSIRGTETPRQQGGRGDFFSLG